MRRDWMGTIGLAAAAGAVGYAGWSGYPLMLPAAIAFPAIWSMARSRVAACLVSAAYFLAASRGLPQGVAAFYRSDLWPGLALWLMASCGFVLVHALLWTREGDVRKIVRYLLAMVLMALPPFGIIGWAHPITAAGILLPGWGWLGLITMAAGLAIMTTRYRPAAAIAFCGLWLWSAACWTPDPIRQAWRGVDLTLGDSLGRDPSLTRQHDLLGLVRRGASDGHTIAVLPESAVGFWTPTVERFWKDGLSGTGLTVVAGAAVVDGDGYDNVLVRVSQDGGDVVYRERMPVPGSMWQPWLPIIGKSGGARAHFFANPTVEIAGQRIAPLICYEQLIVWPILQSMLDDPDLIVAVGNGWWTADTSIIAIQRASVTAWARLFDKPIVMSFNL